MKHINSILFFLLWTAFSAFSQSTEVVTIAGKEYYVHQVKGGETLYGISRMYKIDIDDLNEENPILLAGLKPNQELKIPVDKVKSPLPTQSEQTIPSGFFEHKVTKGETLYAISKKYNITVREVLENNPEVVNGLKLGQSVLIQENDNQEELQEATAIIPKKAESPIAETTPNAVIDTNKFIQHEVQQGETLYSLSRKYEVDAGEVMKLNNGLPEGLKAGMLLLIPKEKPVKIIIIKDVVANFDTLLFNDSTINKNIFNIALMLPFYLNEIDTLESKRKKFEKETIYGPSKLALQFYQGALLAVDSLRKKGISVRLYVYDTANDTAVVNQILERPEIDSINLFIGPLFKQNFIPVSKVAKKMKVGIVTPVPQSNKVLLGNSYVSKVSASRMIQVEKLATYVLQKHINDNVFVFNNYDGKEIKFVDHFHATIRRLLDSIPNSPIDSVREIYFAKIKASKIKVLLDSAKQNVIVIPSNNHSFVSEFLTQLNLLSDVYDITVYGLDKWKGFEDINTEYLHNLNVHITAPSFVNYHDKEEIKLMKAFRQKYFSDPSKYGFLGFDVTYYYVNVLKKYGTSFQNNLPEAKHKGIITSFDYFQTSPESGFENKSASILYYKDFRLHEVE